MVDNYNGHLDEFVILDDAWMWDEWNFYYDLSAVFSILYSRSDDIKEFTENYDIICSLGKSGLVFAAYLSVFYKKPLVIFSVGEFIDDGSYVIGLGKNEAQLIKGKSVLIVDSHVRSGNTMKSINHYFINKTKVGWFVIMDCRPPSIMLEMRGFNIKSLYTFNKDTQIRIENKTKKNDLFQNDDFWMKREKYWLGREDMIMKVDYNGDISFENIKNNIHEYDISKYLDISDGFVYPLELYYKADSYNKLTNYLYEIFSKGCNFETNKGYLFIPLTLGAVPLAVSLAIKYNIQSKDVKLLFPLYRSAEYYNSKVDNCKDYVVVMIDDVITTGGLAYSFYSKFIENKNDCVNIAALMKLRMQGENENEYAKYYCGLVEKISKKSGLIVVGNIYNTHITS